MKQQLDMDLQIGADVAALSAEVFVVPEKALADYLGMGTKRSLSKLIQHYTNLGLKPPSLSTLKNWSSQFNWQIKANESMPLRSLTIHT